MHVVAAPAGWDVSLPQTVSHSPRSVPMPVRIAVRVASGLAAVLAVQAPRRIERVLRLLRKGAAAATYARTRGLRDATTAVSLPCAGPEGCIRRSITVALLCRAGGMWPTWCVGVRSVPPFSAHAWVEAEGEMVGESLPREAFLTIITVPPRTKRREG